MDDSGGCPRNEDVSAALCGLQDQRILAVEGDSLVRALPVCIPSAKGISSGLTSGTTRRGPPH